jgi:L-threonylcarbamoyladenylate synthase
MLIDINEACALVKSGRIIGLPTDTVYGLAASLYNKEAISELYSLKRRPKNNPFVIQVNQISQIKPFVHSFPPGFNLLANKYWPGALTLVVPINEAAVPEVVRASLPTAAFRIPESPLTLQLLKESGPLAVPSANFSGEAPATSPQEVESVFGSDFPVLDGGVCNGLASTILCFADGKWVVSRQGALSPVIPV